MTGSQPTHASRRILRPARPGFIFLTLLAALCLNLVPLGKLPGVPDFLALTLLFWCIHQPMRIGMGAGLLLGTAVDVGASGVLGQHALAYVLLAYAGNSLSRRILWFPLARQAAHILPMMLGMQLLVWLIAALAGRDSPGLWWLLGAFVATLLWAPVTYVLLAPQYQPESKDVHRPI